MSKGHEFELASEDGEGQGILACCSPWGHKESNTTERLNNNKGKAKWKARGLKTRDGNLWSRSQDRGGNETEKGWTQH